MLGDMLSSSGDTEAAQAFETVRFIERLGDVQATTYDRQLLRFELDHDGADDDILARARASVRERPDWSGHDTVAWALYRLGRFDEAVASIAAARALGADDARLRFHEGAIQVARGDVGGVAAPAVGARPRPGPDPLEPREARASWRLTGALASSAA